MTTGWMIVLGAVILLFLIGAIWAFYTPHGGMPAKRPQDQDESEILD